MPVPTHFKFTVRGIFVNTPEAWSFGFKMSRANQGEVDAGFDDINEGDVTAALVTFMGSGIFNQLVEVSDWRCYVIGTDGKMEGNAPLIHEFEPGELSGSDPAPRFPPQISLVITTVGADRGPGQFGRFYLPGPTLDLETDFRVTDASAGTAAEAATQFLKSVSDAIDLEVLTQAAAVNVSTGPTGSPNGTIQEVDHIEVGRVYDTLRNRRKSMLEERHVHGHIDW